MRLPTVIVLLAMALLVAGNLFAAAPEGSYRYISAADLEKRLNSGQPTHIVDIQIEEEYAQHHITGATATYAYPVKSDADKAKLAAVLEELKGDTAPVVIVCPRGAGGATRTYDYLLSQGLEAGRLLILEKGQGGWSCAALTEGR